MIEPIRGCGFRKVGGLYFVGSGLSVPCDRLPFPLEVCPCCGEGIKFSRGFRFIDAVKLLGGRHENCQDEFPSCPVCYPEILEDGKAGLMWVGERYYTTESFIRESRLRSACKRISSIPRGFKVGETWIFLAHRKAARKLVKEKVNNALSLENEISKYIAIPGIFYAFRPQRIEMLIWKSEATEEKILELEERGITPIIVPDGDKDHDPKRKITSDLKLHKEKMKKEQQLLEV